MTASVLFSLIVITFTPMHDGGNARADVWVVDHGLTGEDCMSAMRELDPDKYGDHTVITCSFDYDY